MYCSLEQLIQCQEGTKQGLVCSILHTCLYIEWIWGANAPHIHQDLQHYSEIFFKLSRPPRYTLVITLTAVASFWSSAGVADVSLRLKVPFHTTTDLSLPAGLTVTDET